MAGLGNAAGGGSLSGAIRAGRAYVELLANDNALMRAFDRIKLRFQVLSNLAVSAGKKLFGGGLLAGAPLAASTKVFADFDDAIRLAGAVSGATEKELDSLTEVAKELGRTTSFTAAEVAKLMVELGRAGFKPKEIEDATAAVLNLARATGTEAPLAAEIMSSTLRQFALDASQSARVADALTAAANKSNASVEGLGDSLKYAGPVAYDFGLSVEDTLALLGALANIGIKGEQAGTSLRRLGVMASVEGAKLNALGVSVQDAAGNLRPLVDIMDDLFKATNKMGSVQRSVVLNDIFGLLGITSASALSQNVKSVRELRDAIGEAGGEASRTAVKMDAGIGGAWRKFLSAVEGIAIAIGNALAPALIDVASVLSAVANAVTNFVKENGDLVRMIGRVVLAVLSAGGALLVLGTLGQTIAFAINGLMAFGGIVVGTVVTAVDLLVTAIGSLFTPVGAILIAVAALGYLFVTQTEEGQKFFESLKEGFYWLLDATVEYFTDLYAIATQAWGGIVAAIGKGDLKLAIQIAVTSLELIWAKTFLKMLRVWNDFKSIFVDGWHAVTGGLGPILKEMWEIVNNIFNQIEDAVLNAWEGIKLAFEKTVDFLKPVIKRLEPLIAPLVAPFVLVADLIEKAWDGMSNNLAETLVTFATWVERTFTRMGDKITNVFNGIARTVLDTALDVAKGLDSIDPTDSLKASIANLEALRARVAKDVSEEETAAKEAKLNAERDALIDQIKAENKKAADERKAGRDEAARKAEQTIKDLMAKLQKLLEEASKPPPLPNVFFDSPAAETAFTASLRATQQRARGTYAMVEDSKGTFSAAQASQFGGQSVNTKQLKAMEAVKDNTADTVKAVADLAKGLRFN